MPPKEERPQDGAYYEVRHPNFSQGDVFRDVPRSFPVPEAVVLDDDQSRGNRLFLCGPLTFGLAMLINPTCSMRAQGADGYAYPSRTLVPIVGMEEAAEYLDAGKIGLARKYDTLKNYMYIPRNDGLGIPEGFSLLYMPITLHHEFLTAEGQRLTQLTKTGAQQLLKKLVWFYSDVLPPRSDFDPPLD